MREKYIHYAVCRILPQAFTGCHGFAAISIFNRSCKMWATLQVLASQKGTETLTQAKNSFASTPDTATHHALPCNGNRVQYTYCVLQTYLTIFIISCIPVDGIAKLVVTLYDSGVCTAWLHLKEWERAAAFNASPFFHLYFLSVATCIFLN